MARKSIFSEENQVKGNWFKFTDVGDRIEGTLVGKREAFNSLSGKDQVIYEVQKEDGELWNVGGKPGIDMQMRHVRLGQIIGFEFKEERKSATKGFNATKIIQVYQDREVVDEEWLRLQEEAGAIEETVSTGGADANEATETPVQKFTKSLDAGTSSEEKLASITKIATEKLGASGEADVKVKVMEATGLGFIESMYDEILEALTSL